ncbi:ATP-binding protein [Streptomyces sp. NBC_01236]|uniref:ATP-binding protein n=1 Tax=Streptomyces sp. NBC_01236 TaxID=2903789 RepID=UPI002E15F5A3|nr:ATP-binding protein [Streptomyces sp. NBC_01236]
MRWSCSRTPTGIPATGEAIPDETRGRTHPLSLRAAAGGGSLLVAVDDVHLADEASRHWLAHLARRVDRLPLLMALTERHQCDVDGPVPPGAARGPPPELVVTEWLEPLPPEAVTAVIQDRLAVAPDPATESPAAAGCGNPMLLHALLDDLCGPAARDGFTEAVDWWLESAGPQTTELALTVAELDGLGYVTAELLAEVAQADKTRVCGWLAAMGDQGFLAGECSPPGDQSPRFAHPLLRDAVLARWPTRRRALVHLRTAEVLFRESAPVDAVARHLLKAPAVGEEWAVDALVEASGQASCSGRAPEAIALLRRSLAEPLAASRLVRCSPRSAVWRSGPTVRPLYGI